MYCQLYCLSKDGKTRAKGNDVIRMDFFDADIQIPET